MPLLYVLATRPEPQGAASSLNKALTAEDRTVQQVRILALAPLATEQSAELAEQLLGGGALPSEVRDLLLRRSGGNPFYLGELVRTLIGTKGIERDMLSGNWRTTDQYGAVPLPDTIEGVILARIDRLEDEVKQVLKAAAVVGRTFFYRVLKAVTVANAALDDDLSKLRGAELIDEKQLMPELEYVFKHPLIQQATYDSMLEDRRRELHRQVGASIEQLFAERLEPFYSMLAYHYAKAEDWTKGREYLFKAAEHADRLAADEEALELYSALIAEADHLPHGGVSSLERAELEMKIGDAHFRAGRFRAARAALAGALHRVGMPLPRSRFQLGFSVMVGLARHLMARFDGREEVAEKSPMTTGKQIGCQLLDRLALIDFFIDPLAYVCDGLQMSRLSAAHPSTSWHTLSLSHVGLSFDALGLYRAADRYHKRSRALAARFGDANARGMADYFDSLHHHVIGEWAIARERGERAADLLLEAGSTRFWAGAMANRALILRCMGLPQWMSSALEIAKTAAETNDQQALGWAASVVALAQCDRGEHELSYATMERAVNLFRAVPDSRLLAFALGVQSICLRWLDRLDEAIAHAAEAQVLIQRNRFTGTWVTPPILAAADNYLVVFEAGDPVQRTKMRDATLKAVKAMLRQGRNVRDESPVEAQRVAATFAWLCGNQRGALAHWSKGLDEAKALGAPHAEARVLFERGQRMNCAHDVQQALQLFTECGALGEMRRAQDVARNLMPPIPTPV